MRRTPCIRASADPHAAAAAAEARLSRFTRRAALRGGASAALLLTLAAGPARAGEPPVYSDWRGRAIRGTDPVAYFTEGRPVQGSADITYEWKGAEWRFASEEHRALFIADPEAYAPQYGGYCAWAVSHGQTASTEPDAWEIVDGKLYLNYNKDVQAQWVADRPAAFKRAEANWPKVLD